jgi:hypothetical protein
VEQIAGHPADTHIIVDTGSSAFVPLVHYVVTNECLRFIKLQLYACQLYRLRCSQELFPNPLKNLVPLA